MSTQKFSVDVEAEEAVVRSRLNEVAEDPQEVVRWFTSDPDVTASVTPHGDLWQVEVEGSAFIARGTVELKPRDPGSALTVALHLKGKGLLAFAGPMLSAAGGKIEGSVRSTLHREFGTP